METFEPPRKLVNNQNFEQTRNTWLGSLDLDSIDAPITDLIRSLNTLPFCFTLQSCFGHFLYEGQDNKHNTTPLPNSPLKCQIQYRIAYLALCIADNQQGRKFIEILTHVPSPHPDIIQFGSAAYFWEKQVNSYVLQIGPVKLQDKDTMEINYQEAISVQTARNYFFQTIEQIIKLVTR